MIDKKTKKQLIEIWRKLDAKKAFDFDAAGFESPEYAGVIGKPDVHLGNRGVIDAHLTLDLVNNGGLKAGLWHTHPCTGGAWLSEQDVACWKHFELPEMVLLCKAGVFAFKLHEYTPRLQGKNFNTMFLSAGQQVKLERITLFESGAKQTGLRDFFKLWGF